VSKVEAAEMATRALSEARALGNEDVGQLNPHQIWMVHLWEAPTSGRSAMAQEDYVNTFDVSSTLSMQSTYPQVWSFPFWENTSWAFSTPRDPLATPTATATTATATANATNPAMPEAGAGPTPDPEAEAYVAQYGADVHGWPVVDVSRPREHLVFAAYSNCRASSERDQVLKRLINAFPPGAVHSYGKCEHNKDWPGGAHDIYGRQAKTDYRILKAALAIQYKFEVVMQNAICFDYVDEKLYEALQRGSIPIYMGAPNVLEFLPRGHKMLIRVEDFANEVALAEYVLALAADPAAMREYHTWRTLLPLTLPVFMPRLRPGSHDAVECISCQEATVARLFRGVNADAPRPGRDDSCCDLGQMAGCRRMAEYYKTHGGAKRVRIGGSIFFSAAAATNFLKQSKFMKS
jgi:hypothetical protein